MMPWMIYFVFNLRQNLIALDTSQNGSKIFFKTKTFEKLMKKSISEQTDRYKFDLQTDRYKFDMQI